jgi:hypothetical protein
LICSDPHDQDHTARIQLGQRGNLEPTRAIHQGINGRSPVFYTERPRRRRPSDGGGGFAGAAPNAPERSFPIQPVQRRKGMMVITQRRNLPMTAKQGQPATARCRSPTPARNRQLPRAPYTLGETSDTLQDSRWSSRASHGDPSVSVCAWPRARDSRVQPA